MNSKKRVTGILPDLPAHMNCTRKQRHDKGIDRQKKGMAIGESGLPSYRLYRSHEFRVGKQLGEGGRGSQEIWGNS